MPHNILETVQRKDLRCHASGQKEKPAGQNLNVLTSFHY